MATEQATARTPLHHWHVAHGARMGERAGWHVPLSYTEVPAEVAVARTATAVVDASAFPKWALLGAGVQALVESSFPDSAALRPQGVVSLAGGDGLACRLTPDSLLLLDTGRQPNALETYLARAEAIPGLLRQDVTCAQAAFHLLGPEVEAVLAGMTPFDASRASIPEGACAETGVAGVHALLVRPPGAGTASLLLCVAWDVAEYVWERVLESGRVTPVGLESLAVLLRG